MRISIPFFLFIYKFESECQRLNSLIKIVSPNKHGNSMTIFNLSTSAQLGCKVNVLRGCVPANQAEVDYKFNIVTELPCLLEHAVDLSLAIS